MRTEIWENIETSNGCIVSLKCFDEGGQWAVGSASVRSKAANMNFEFDFECKHDEAGYGIDNGRISKLWIKDGDKTNPFYPGACLLNYDRGWDFRFEDFKLVFDAAYEAILKKFN